MLSAFISKDRYWLKNTSFLSTGVLSFSSTHLSFLCLYKLIKIPQGCYYTGLAQLPRLSSVS